MIGTIRGWSRGPNFSRFRRHSGTTSWQARFVPEYAERHEYLLEIDLCLNREREPYSALRSPVGQYRSWAGGEPAGPDSFRGIELLVSAVAGLGL